MKLLLHICCAPCTIYPARILREEGVDILGFFYNPNIHPYQEYQKRLDALREYKTNQGLEVLISEGYPLEDFLRGLVQSEGDRCAFCYSHRLQAAAVLANREGIKTFSTTLLYSRYQKHDLIREIGEQVALKYDLKFLYRDFREGWTEGQKSARTVGLYRQRYCGCIYSEKERYFKG
ncbi:MAG: epoxyqueuosine reductase QueH [Deltaproteobacteria bacterium]|nr:epoxyqueuosine reductase QueH [Deltaproteobacteria bacterium]